MIASLTLIAGIAVVDIWLAGLAGRHKVHVGQELFERGMAASKTGRQTEALELFRGAFNRNPTNREYHLAFARSLREHGRIEESKAVLGNLLEQSPTYGSANAEFARMLAREDDWQQASWYYHRALYGEWKGTADLRPLRFELADLLAQHDATEQLLAEVLMLEATGGRALNARHMAQLSLAAGDWSRAEREYQALLDENPDDPGLLVGLARARFGAGKYIAAQRSFERALKFGANSDRVQRELQRAETVNQLDPTLRRLSAAEKHRRSHELVTLLLQPLAACTPESRQVVEGSAALASHQRVRNAFAASEADLELFEELWANRDSICKAGATYPKAVELLAEQLVK
jgi:tetratricopeptide (TPR) repeat protein